VFIFNDTPTGALRREGFNHIGGVWEKWYNQYYEDMKLDGKNSLWLVYICLSEQYCVSKEFMKKIFHKVHLSLYTTLPNIKACFSIFSTIVFKDISEAESKEDDENYENIESIVVSPHYIVKTLLTYLYKPVPELDFPLTKDPNNLALLITVRDTVFPLIEIRPGTQEDHDDLENIFKDQTPSDVANSYEDFFIAKMIADKDPTKKVLVGQVNDKAVGMLAISTDVNVNLLSTNFELEQYDNLSKQDYMRAVKLKRKQITEQCQKEKSEEELKLEHDYLMEIKSCEPISQRVLLQEYVINNQDQFLPLEKLEKIKNSNEQIAIDYFTVNLEKFEIKYPNLDPFYSKIKIDDGNSLLVNKLTFYLETLEYFGLPKNYLKGEGHWENYIKQLEKKKAMREAWKKQMQKDSKPTKKTQKKAQKGQDEFAKKKDFDFEPFDTALAMCKRANINSRSTVRKIINENRGLIASFFVNEEGEPSELRCFDLLLLPKKLKDNKINFPEELTELFSPILTCFGNLQYDKTKVMRIIESEDKGEEKKKDEKKKKDPKKKKEVVVEEKKEVKPQEVTAYFISIGEFFKAVDLSFEYDKTLSDMGFLNSDKFVIELNDYENKLEEAELLKIKTNFTEYQNLYKNMEKENLEKSKNDLERYSKGLEGYTNSSELPPFPNEVLNAFCVKLFFIEQAFESRSTDFLLKAFDAFPDKDFMVITQPHHFTENTLLEPFIKIPKKVDSLFPEILYILHRESMLISLMQANFATLLDLENSIYLFENAGSDANYIYNICCEAINNEDCKFNCITVKIESNVIGICLISKEINIDYYDSHFTVRDYLNLDKLSKYYHGRILFFSLHKNFTQHTKLVFKEITRLLNKFSLYFEVYTDLNYPAFVKEMIHCKNRRFPHLIVTKEDVQLPNKLYEDEKIKSRMDGEEREEYDREEGESCLMMITKKMFYDSKIANNNKIVIVGASDAGISFIESLLSIRYLSFSYIYLVAPGGLLYHHISSELENLKVSYTSYQLTELKKLLLENRIKVIDSKMKRINRSNKFITLEDNSILNYDYLILTLGLQDKLCVELGNTVKIQIIDEFTNKVKEKESEIALNNELLNNQNNQQQGQLKEGKDPKKENQKLNLEIQQINSNKNKILSSLNFISVDDPKIYSIFSPGNKLMKSLKKNPLFELIVYGRSFNLYCFIQGMLERGIQGNKMKLIIPSKTAHVQYKDKKELSTMTAELDFTNTSSLESSPEIEKHIVEVLEKKGVKVLKNYDFSDVVYNETFESIAGYNFQVEGTGTVEFVTGNYFVTGGLINVDQNVFHFIHDNGLVYNGRAIIDKNFMTSDQYIFAAGRLCEFSQRYSYSEKGKLLKLESYNSREVGYTLAKSFLSVIESVNNPEVENNTNLKVPSFYLPLSFGGVLPDKYHYLKIHSVKETNELVLMKPKTRDDLVFNNLESTENPCFLKFSFNTFGSIEEITFYGKTQVSYNSLISLVGLHETYLNDLMARTEVKLVEDIPLFLSENWSMALFHDNFSKLILKLKSVILEKDNLLEIQNLINSVNSSKQELDRNYISTIVNSVSSDIKKKIEFEIIQFLFENRNHLPFYHIPQVFN